jgi:hypothetical protein
MIEIPHQFRNHQGELVDGDFYWIDVLLKDGTAHKGLTTNGREIFGTFNRADGGYLKTDFPFVAEDIFRVRPHRVLPFWQSVLGFFAPPRDLTK